MPTKASKAPPKSSEPDLKVKKLRAAAAPAVAPGIQHYLQSWATELDKDPETLKKALIKSDYRPVPNEVIPLRAIVAALFGEEHVEKVRAMRLDNEERERNAKERIGVLLEWDAVEAFLMRQFVNPMVSALDAAPKELDREWVEKVLKPVLRQTLTPPKPDDA